MDKQSLVEQIVYVNRQINTIKEGSKLENTLTAIGLIASLGVFASILKRMDYLDLILITISGLAFYKERKRNRLLQMYQNELQQIHAELSKISEQ